MKYIPLGIAAALLLTPGIPSAWAGGLLSNVVGVGEPSGIVDLNSSTPSVNPDSSGPVINLPDVSGSTGLPGAATVEVSSGSGDSNGTGTILGGGGTSVDVPLGSVLGGSSGVSVDLPGSVAVIGGGPDTPRAPGNPGGGANPSNPGLPGSAGTPSGGTGGPFSFGRGSTHVFIASTGNGGSALQAGGNASSRLRLLLRILAERDYLKLISGKGLCVPGAGKTTITKWVRRDEVPALRQAVKFYAADIARLQKLLGVCEANSALLRKRDINRVIAIDIHNGQPVLFML